MLQVNIMFKKKYIILINIKWYIKRIDKRTKKNKNKLGHYYNNQKQPQLIMAYKKPIYLLFNECTYFLVKYKINYLYIYIFID